MNITRPSLLGVACALIGLCCGAAAFAAEPQPSAEYYRSLPAAASRAGASGEQVSGSLQEDEVVSAARRFLESHRSSLPSMGLGEPERLKTGRPVQVFEFSMEAVRAYKKGRPVSKSLQATQSWYVPVEDSGTGEAAFVDVGCCSEKIEGRLIGKGLGWSPLAKKWKAVTAKWPDAKLVSCPPGQAMYYTVPSSPAPNLTPMSSFEKGDDFLKLKGAEETLKPLKQGRYPGLGAGPR